MRCEVYFQVRASVEVHVKIVKDLKDCISVSRLRKISKIWICSKDPKDMVSVHKIQTLTDMGESKTEARKLLLKRHRTTVASYHCQGLLLLLQWGSRSTTTTISIYRKPAIIFKAPRRAFLIGASVLLDLRIPSSGSTAIPFWCLCCCRDC